MTRLYTDLADWWHLLSPPEEYIEEAAFFTNTLIEHASGPLGTLLELGSGGGNNASHMKRHFDVTLVDLSERMIQQSQRLNPELEHHVGDMRTIRLGRTFDAVFVHDAVAYMTTAADLGKAIETAYVHCRPGGVALFAPDFVRETFSPSTECGGSDEGARGIRYLEWTRDPDPSDDVCTVDYVYLMRTETGKVEVVHEEHDEGLFSRDRWLDLFTSSGFTAKVVPFRPTEIDACLELFICSRPAASAKR